MIDYINGDEKAGEKLELKAAVHIIADVTIVHFGMKASQEFAKIHLDQRIGSFFAKAFERTSIGCDGALEILNKISPKYTEVLTTFIKKYDTNAAYYVVATNDANGISGVEQAMDNFESGNVGKRISSEEVIFGSETKPSQKLKNQMEKRGWTEESVKYTIDNPYTLRISVNKATGNTATVFYNESGSYVIVDDIEKTMVQVSDNLNPLTWIPDENIINPYKPGE